MGRSRATSLMRIKDMAGPCPLAVLQTARLADTGCAGACGARSDGGRASPVPHRGLCGLQCALHAVGVRPAGRNGVTSHGEARMARGTSVNFKAVKNLRHEDRHNRREGREPRYLLPPEHRLRDSSGEILASVLVRNDPGLHERYMARLAQCSERAKRAKAFSPFWSGVVVLPLRDPGDSVDAYRDRLTQTMLEWCQGYEMLTGHEVLQCALHFDEGHIEELTGEMCLNPHAHVLVDRMREREAHVIQTRTGERRIPARVSVIELDRETMRRVQDMTCRLVTGESAAGRRARVAAERETARRAGLPPRGHINHREFRAMMQEAGRERQRERVKLQARIDVLEAELLECSRDLAAAAGVPSSVDHTEPDNRQRVFREALDQVQRAQRDRTDYEALEHRAAALEKAAREAWRKAQDTKSHSALVTRALERAGADAQAAEAAHPEKITPEEIERSRRALESHARGRGIPVDEGYRSLRAAWITENEREARIGRPKPHAQQHYSALKLAHLELQAERRTAQRVRAKCTRERHVQAARERMREGIASTGGLISGYRSAEIAAARACGLHYEWDAVARCRRYRDRAGREVFTATRTRVELVQHDEAAEAAALRIAAARFGGAVSLTGSGEFRGRMARRATREGIRVVDADLARIVMDEQTRMARGAQAAGTHAVPARVPRIERPHPSHRDLMAWWQRMGGHERTAWLEEAVQAGRKSEHPGDGLLNAWHTMRDCEDAGGRVPQSITEARQQDRAMMQSDAEQDQEDEQDCSPQDDFGR